MADLTDQKLFYVLDSRGAVGNCGLWWRAGGAGYACDLDDAGKFTEQEVRRMRDTDLPFHVEEIDRLAVRHARVDTPAFGVLRETARKFHPPAPPKPRSCNKHDDCDAAEKRAAERGVPERYGPGSPRLDHCSDETCEDCFGS